MKKKAIEFAIENCPGCTDDAIGVAEVWVGEWVYADSIEIDSEDGEPYAWHDVYGELEDTIYTVTTATPESAEKCGLLNADEYGDQSIKESLFRRESIRRRRAIKSLTESRDNIRDSIARKYESLSSSDAKRIMDNLREQNAPHTLDSEGFRMDTALNLFQKLLNERDKGYPYNSDLNVFYKFKDAGYMKASDLIRDIAGAINRRIRELTQVKNDLEGLKDIALSFDLKSGHN